MKGVICIMFKWDGIASFCRKNSKEIALVSAVGTLALAVWSAFFQGKKCQRAEDKIEMDVENYDEYERAVVKNEIKHLVPVAVPAFICAFSIGFMYGVSERREKALTSALLLVQSRFNNYRRRVELKDPELYEEINDDIAKDAEKDGIFDTGVLKGEKSLFYDTIGEEWFYSSLPDVHRAAYLVNRYFDGFDQIQLNQAREIFGLPEKDWGWSIGWDKYIGETHYGYRWIDINFVDKVKSDGTPYTEVQWPFGPHPLDKDDIDDYSMLDYRSPFAEESYTVTATNSTQFLKEDI